MFCVYSDQWSVLLPLIINLLFYARCHRHPYCTWEYVETQFAVTVSSCLIRLCVCVHVYVCVCVRTSVCLYVYMCVCVFHASTVYTGDCWYNQQCDCARRRRTVRSASQPEGCTYLLPTYLYCFGYSQLRVQRHSAGHQKSVHQFAKCPYTRSLIICITVRLCSGHGYSVIIRELSLYPQSLFAKLTVVAMVGYRASFHIHLLSALV